MKFYEPLPLRKFSAEKRRRWGQIYAEKGSQAGHTISATDPRTICLCVVCNESNTMIGSRYKRGKQ